MLNVLVWPIKALFALLLFSFLLQTGLLATGLKYAWMLAVTIAPLMLVGDMYVKWSRGYRVFVVSTLFWLFMSSLFISKYIL